MTTGTDWDSRFMQVALLTVQWSKDPRRKVGCSVVRDRNIIASGFNGFPRGVTDDIKRLNDQEVKRTLAVHAEANCVASAARHGLSLLNTTAYVTRPVCTQCAGLLIQAGVKQINYAVFSDMRLSSWRANTEQALEILLEAGALVCPMRDFEAD